MVEHNDGLLGEYDELDMLATDDTARGQLSTTSSSLNDNSAVVMEAALSSAVMHTNVVQTYDYQSHASLTSGGQVTLLYSLSPQCCKHILHALSATKQLFCNKTAVIVTISICS